ncbi:MAG TPA: hypothetical protein VER37_07190 [Thermomicrobiales bacterium]|nr:hypothetical protein [Thermomicrobiales bacterium]
MAIFMAEMAGAPVAPVERAVAGRDLEGDRSFAGTGFPSWYAGPLLAVSLIEALWRDHNLTQAPGLHRRTIVTRGVPLGPPVGGEFAVGGVRLRGVEISEPCTHLTWSM